MQVFDLQEFRPGQVLQQIYKNFEDAERQGDPLAASLKRSASVVGGHKPEPLPSKTQSDLHQFVNSDDPILQWCIARSAANSNMALHGLR